MRAMILAAGQGKRLRPITNTIPKPMVEVAGHTLIYWHLKKLTALGIREIVVNGAYLKDVLFSYLEKEQESFNLKLSFSPEDGDGLETAGGIIKALPLLGTEPFLVVNGDVFISGSYDFVKSCPFTTNAAGAGAQRLAHLYLTHNPQHNAQGDYALTKDGLLQYGHDYTFSGVAWYRPEAFQGHAVAREPLRPYFDRWVAEHVISAEILESPWFDVGTPERLSALNDYLSAHPEAL